MKKNLLILIFVIIITLGTAATSFTTGSTTPEILVQALFQDYKNCSFENALSYTSLELNEHIQQIVNSIDSNYGVIPDYILLNSVRMTEMNIVEHQAFDDQYAYVIANWIYHQEQGYGQTQVRIRKFGFLLENYEGSWYIFEMRQIGERLSFQQGYPN